MSISVHPPTLSQAATQVGSTADGVNQKAQNGMQSSAAAATGNPGFATGGALNACATAWQTHLQQLAAGLNATADALGQTADNYVQTEAALAGNFHHDANQLLQGQGQGAN
ncbi:WXG100 family type VII secretion target [Kitasatospora mediocidica]|uniref:WXG100 family type VII secretion target n=1 Tax=Kitasatospora mediocidica TaxID=58352 RepID=UPI00055E298E|nr:type VII secretion target [Kitasatospora mediocidica]